MTTKTNTGNMVLSFLVCLTLLLSASQPASVMASTSAVQGDGIRRGIPCTDREADFPRY